MSERFTIESATIEITNVDDSVENFYLEAPNDSFEFAIEKKVIRGNYRDRNKVLRKGVEKYHIHWMYEYESHEMDLRRLLAAKETTLKAPPNFYYKDYQSYTVRLVNDEVIKNYLNGVPVATEFVDRMPSGDVTLEFRTVTPLSWDELLALPWFQEEITAPDAPANHVATVDGVEVSFSWDAVADVDGYNLYINKDGAGFVKENSGLITDLEYTIPEAEIADYESYVTAQKFGLESEPSNTEVFAVVPIIEVAGTSTYNTGSASGRMVHDVPMPATVEAGDLLITFFNTEGDHDEDNPSRELVTPAGWTRKIDPPYCPSGLNTAMICVKIADGSEGGTTVEYETPDFNRRAVAQTYRLTNSFQDVAGVEVNYTNSDNPPLLTPSWGAAQNMWFVALFARDNVQSVSAYPDNYTDGRFTRANNSSSHGASLATARQLLSDTSQNPTAFDVSDSFHITATVAVRPVG